MIIEHVWDQSFEGLTNIVDVYVGHLRTKVDDPFATKLIRTVRGAGYYLGEGAEPRIPARSAFVLDLKLGTHFGAVDAALFVNNTTNEHPILTRTHAAPGDPLFMSSTVRPRTIGVNASYRF